VPSVSHQLNFLHYPYFRADEQKQIVLQRVLMLTEKYRVSGVVYSIAMNHFHLRLTINVEDKSRIKQYLRGGISYDYKKSFPGRYSTFWQTHHEMIIENKLIDLKITGYIIGNLLKHREVGRICDLWDCPFSSYASIAKRYGREQADALIRQVINVNENSRGEIDPYQLRQLKLANPS
jgi:hypothetical protein